MDTIETFLDNMFAPYPATPRLIEARSELRAMMEDAYNDAIAQGKTHNEAVGQVITDFGNLHELAPVLGIAQDIQPGVPGDGDQVVGRLGHRFDGLVDVDLGYTRGSGRGRGTRTGICAGGRGRGGGCDEHEATLSSPAVPGL